MEKNSNLQTLLCFEWSPKFSISISIKSPSFRYGMFGLFNATPAAVPVEIISPGSSVIDLLSIEILMEFL